MSEQNTVTWTRPMLARFKQAHKKANGSEFIFDGNRYVSDYAKYLIEYLEDVLPR